MRFGRAKNNDYLPIVQVEGTGDKPLHPGPYLAGEVEDRSNLLVFSDSSFGDDYDTGRSTGGHVAYLKSCPLSFMSKKLSKVATSTCVAELYGLERCAKEAIYLMDLLRELDYVVKKADVIGDNQTANNLMEMAKYSEPTRHIRVAKSYCHQEVKAGNIAIFYGRSQFNVADIMTKPLDRATFERLRTILLGLGSGFETEEHNEE